MRFTDVRPTVYKRTATADTTDSVSTPRRLSPFLEDGVSLRNEVAGADVLRPGHNRRSRRSMGMKRPRRRIGGVALLVKPWQPIDQEGAEA
jgi:hypothetical protein